MEVLEDKIKRFLSVDYGYGDGSGGIGYNLGISHNIGIGYGYGNDDGIGSGYGSGNDYGDGSGYGIGSGDGSGNGLKSYNSQTIYRVDGVLTLIDIVHATYARGCILNGDKSTTPCYIARAGNSFAHGQTLRQAQADAIEKDLLCKPIEERINDFIKKFPKLDKVYSCKDLFDWHGILTSSCQLGRELFCKDNEISLDKSYTVEYFLEITKNAYGGNIIKQLKESYGNENNR